MAVAITLQPVLPKQILPVFLPLMFKESRMAITMFSFGSLFAPLNGLLSWFAPATGTASAPLQRVDHSSDVRPAVLRPAVLRSNRLRPSRPLATANCRKSARPLRVFRARGDLPAPETMRIAISGSIADVCAELDRLAALEANRG